MLRASLRPCDANGGGARQGLQSIGEGERGASHTILLALHGLRLSPDRGGKGAQVLQERHQAGTVEGPVALDEHHEEDTGLGEEEVGSEERGQ